VRAGALALVQRWMCAFEALMVGKAFLQCRFFPAEGARGYLLRFLHLVLQT